MISPLLYSGKWIDISIAFNIAVNSAILFVFLPVISPCILFGWLSAMNTPYPHHFCFVLNL